MKKFQMRGFGLGSYKYPLLATLIVFGSLGTQLGSAQGNKNSKNGGYRLSVVGIAVSDYAKSQYFYGTQMGLREAFKFSKADGKGTVTYYQLSRDTFLEMEQTTGDVHPGYTHVHLAVDDLNGTIARLKQAGIPGAARNATTPGTVTETGVAQPSNVKNANIFDPAGLRLELNELGPESLTTKATESWLDTYPTYRLWVIGINYNQLTKDFYEEKMGFKEVFTINTPDHPYLQMSRDTFVDFMQTRNNAAPSFTHIHIVVDDLTKTVARLKQNGITLTAEPAFSPPTQLYSAHFADPDGLAIEVNQWVESLPKKAAEAWK
jgi:catechol 2,3-dioxygenase-like lactoylglutathione lyase family enzyme